MVNGNIISGQNIFIDHQHVHGYPIEHEDWERICSRCGFIEKIDSEPQELINARKGKIIFSKVLHFIDK